MDLDAAREFMREHHRAVLATRRPGGIQQSPVLVNVDAEGRAIISSRETAYKVINLRRDRWAQLCVFTERFSATGSTPRARRRFSRCPRRWTR